MMHPSNSDPVAYFDFDGTLTIGDTLMPFLRFVAGTGRYYAKLTRVSPSLLGYFMRMVRNDVVKEAVINEFLAGLEEKSLRELGEGFAREILPSLLRPQGMERLKWHQQQGHVCVLISASVDLYLEPWSQAQGFDQLICSKLETDEAGALTGKLSGANCYGQEKLRRAQAWQQGRTPTKTYAYGDTQGDIPLIRFVETGYLWDPRLNQFKVDS